MKKIVIMGASSGIGFELAKLFVSRGVHVGLAARHTDSLYALKEKYPDLVEYASVDISKPEAVDLTHYLIERLGGMDIYIHAAGIGYANPDLDPEGEVRIVDIDCCGFARMLSMSYNYFRNRGINGQICAVTSVAGTKGIGRLSAYSASKAFCQEYVVALRQRACNEKSGILLTDIRPGWVRTPLLNKEVKYPMSMDVEYVARRIIKALARREETSIIDWRWNIVSRIWTLLPDRMWTRMDIPLSSPDMSLPTVPES